MIDWERITGFDWDAGNVRKNADKHDVSRAEAEQIFFNDPLVTVLDLKHTAGEDRFHALGRTDAGRLLHVTFTLRSDASLIRGISARDMSRRERGYYEQTE